MSKTDKPSGEATPPKHRRGLLPPWKPGQSGNPEGRPKGSRNKLGEEFIAKLYEDFKAHGPAAIVRCRQDDPSGYVRVISNLLPKEVQFREARLDDMTDDDIRDALARIAAIRVALIGHDGAYAKDDPGAETAGKPH